MDLINHIGNSVYGLVAAFLKFFYAGAYPQPSHAPVDCPAPSWLKCEEISLKCLSIGITGNSGVGKSSILNTIRYLSWKDSASAKTGTIETTMKPTRYGSGLPMLDPILQFFDLPGAGTVKFLLDTYIEDMGLRHFDMIILVLGERVTEHDVKVICYLKKYNIPMFVARSKMDQVLADANYKELDVADVFQTIRSYISTECGISKDIIYLLTSRRNEPFNSNKDKYDHEKLASDMNKGIVKSRGAFLELLNFKFKIFGFDGMLHRFSKEDGANEIPVEGIKSELESKERKEPVQTYSCPGSQSSVSQLL